MALKPTTWHPYNCQCVIEYMADPDVPAMPVTYSRHIQVCAAHATLTGNFRRWEAAVDESISQGTAMAAIQELLGESTTMVVSQDPTYVGNGRVIRISVLGATPQQLAQVRAAIAPKLAAGKVIIS